jgi:tRNA pseudouridine38-40 synthase
MRAFRLAYDGRPFRGFQRQPHGDTVEDALFDALDALGVELPPAGYAAAGRTDAGVSALAQTVAFDAPEWCLPRALNAELPESVRAWARADAPAGFHATHDAVTRAYTYFLYGPNLDDDRARAAADALAGDHDFANLTPDDRGTVRDLSVAVERDGPFLVCEFRAGGFARHLVRRAVSLLRGVAAGERAVGAVDDLLGPETVPGPRGVSPASPHPLLLAGVDYPDLEFVRDPEAVSDARAAFSGRRAEHAALARVAGTVADGL